MLKNDTLKNGTSRIGLYGSAPPGSCIAVLNSEMKLFHKVHKLKSSAADEINIISIDSS